MARIAVIGAGAVGGSVAAWLAEAGHEVALCVRSPIDALIVETPAGTLRPSLAIWTAPSQAGPVDWAIAATKAYDAAAAASWLPALLAPASRLAILQNGIEHRLHFDGVIAVDRQVPAVVDIPAERDAPGRIRQRRIGSILVPDDDAGMAFAALFDRTPIEAAATPAFAEAAWRKLALNCAGAVNALTLLPAGISRNDDIAEVMRAMVRECAAVARAQGIALPDDLADEVVDAYRAGPTDSVNSLLADRLAGRRMEIDARNGVIVRLGARHDVATPLNAMAVALLSAVQPG
jgi:2-dehydropantoate 2-reductase